ncbi:RNA-binding protein pno1 isoform X2 [Topomyia yanbarensis]|uniref:RNA-binding protein pno1 isoform X2 n=1 Tax=Topomyia yanbarensis TaxID=2498891 RepID=UPI00273C0886|nr:RNA-binding protein pno1 isoform X2 [Topomyia yanbarensis]
MEVDPIDVQDVPDVQKNNIGKLQLKQEVRKVFVPRSRQSALKEQWLNIFTPVVEQLLLQIRYNVKTKQVEIRLGPEMQDPANLQKGTDFVIT